MRATLNMNDRVRVRLTETGLRALDKYEADLGLPEKHRRSSVTEGNVWIGPLWSLMQDFGPSTSMGFDGAFIENRIEWENTAEQSVCDHRIQPHGGDCAKCGSSNTGAY